MIEVREVLLNELLGWFEPDSCEAGVVQPEELERLADALVARLELARAVYEGPGSREPFPTRLKYGSPEFSGPRDVYINGQRVQGVLRLVTEHEDVQFSKVTLVIGGVLVEACPVEVP